MKLLKHLTLLAATLPTLSVFAAGNVANGIYLGAEGGYGKSAVYGGRIGYHINPLFSADVSYDVRNQIHNQTTLFNLYYTPNLQWSMLDPFLTSGIGYGWNTTGNKRNGLAWQVGVGANFDITPHIFFDAGYRYVGFPAATIGHEHSNDVFGGINYRL